MISCQAYDYIEIACMHRLRVRLVLNQGDSIEGTALDTTRTTDNQEALLLEESTGAIKVPLENIKTIAALTKNPYFSEVDISSV
jgi:Rho-binding antiterminator